MVCFVSVDMGSFWIDASEDRCDMERFVSIWLLLLHVGMTRVLIVCSKVSDEKDE